MIRAARQWLRYVLFVAIAAFAAGGLWMMLRPSPVDVEVAPVERGLLRVTLDEQAETRSHDRFVITAPVAGRVLRLELHEGDSVTEARRSPSSSPHQSVNGNSGSSKHGSPPRASCYTRPNTAWR